MKFPALKIERDGVEYDLTRLEKHVWVESGGAKWCNTKWDALYESDYNFPDIEITYEWQDESRTWLTIDEVQETIWDCHTARREAAIT